MVTGAMSLVGSVKKRTNPRQPAGHRARCLTCAWVGPLSDTLTETSQTVRGGVGAAVVVFGADEEQDRCPKCKGTDLTTDGAA